MYDNILIYIPRNVAIKYCYLDKTDEKRCAFARYIERLFDFVTHDNAV